MKKPLVLLLLLLPLIAGVVWFMLPRPESDTNPVEAEQNYLDPELAKVEGAALERTEGPITVSREETLLKLYFPDGETLEFEDCDECERPQKYTLVDRISQPDAVLLHAIYHHEDQTMLLVLANGEVLDIGWYPFFSPLRTKFAVVNYSDAFSFDGWAVWELQVQDGTYRKVDGSESTTWPGPPRVGLIFQRWEDERNVQVLADMMPSDQLEDEEPRCAPAKIQLVEGQWETAIDMESAKPGACEPRPPELPESAQTFF